LRSLKADALIIAEKSLSKTDIIALVDEYVSLPMDYVDRDSENVRYASYSKEVMAHRYYVLLEAAQALFDLKKYNTAYKYLKSAMQLTEINLRLSHLDTLRTLILVSKVLKKLGYRELHTTTLRYITELREICKE
jgi:hypothetical protein